MFSRFSSSLSFANELASAYCRESSDIEPALALGDAFLPLSLSSVFDAEAPLRLWFYGVAGTGKSALCQRIACDWAQAHNKRNEKTRHIPTRKVNPLFVIEFSTPVRVLYSPIPKKLFHPFHLVLWVDLKKLADYLNSADIPRSNPNISNKNSSSKRKERLFYNTSGHLDPIKTLIGYFAHTFLEDFRGHCKFTESELKQETEKISRWLVESKKSHFLLFVFDGFDEVASYPDEHPIHSVIKMGGFLKDFYFIITSRPCVVPILPEGEFQRVGLLGFTLTHCLQYIERYLNGRVELISALISLLRSDEDIRRIAFIPANLNFLCTAHRIEKPPLARKIIFFLLSRYREKKFPEEKEINDGSLLDPSSLLKWIVESRVLRVLGSLAFQDFKKVTADNIMKASAFINDEGERKIFYYRFLNLGLVNGISWNQKQRRIDGEGEFIYPLLQKYFAAWYFVFYSQCEPLIPPILPSFQKIVQLEPVLISFVKDVLNDILPTSFTSIEKILLNLTQGESNMYSNEQDITALGVIDPAAPSTSGVPSGVFLGGLEERFQRLSSSSEPERSSAPEGVIPTPLTLTALSELRALSSDQAVPLPSITDLMQYKAEGAELITESELKAAQPIWKALINGLPLTDIKTKAAESRGCLGERVGGNTLLHAACFYGRSDVIEYLLNPEDGGQDVTMSNSQGLIALHLAALRGHVEIVEILLGYEYNPSLKVSYQDESGKTRKTQLTALHLAVIAGQVTVVEKLLDKVIPSVVVPGFGNILHLAILGGQTIVLQSILRHPKCTRELVNDPDKKERTPLLLAVALGNKVAVLELLKNGLVVHRATTTEGWNVFHFAAKYLRGDLIGELVNHFFPQADGKTFILSLNKDNDSPVQIAEKELKLLRSQGLAPDDRISRVLNSAARNSTFKSMSVKEKTRIWRNMVFQGGGIKGLAYVGVLEAFENQRALGYNPIDQLWRVGGTSAGAITATLLALNISLSELKELMSATDFSDFLEDFDARLLTQANPGFLGKARAALGIYASATRSAGAKHWWDYLKPWQTLRNTKGLATGEGFRTWFENKIHSLVSAALNAPEFLNLTAEERKCYEESLTFGQLNTLIRRGAKLKHLHIVCIRLGDGTRPPEILTLSSEDPRWSDFIISDAVRASMSIPFVFAPHILHRKVIEDGNVKRIPAEAYVCVDGGLIMNCPDELFDFLGCQQPFHPVGDPRYPIHNEETVAIGLHTPISDAERAHRLQQEDFVGFDLAKAVMSIYWNAENLIATQEGRRSRRLISVSNKGIGTLTLNLTDLQKESLIGAGREAIMNYLEGPVKVQHSEEQTRPSRGASSLSAPPTTDFFSEYSDSPLLPSSSSGGPSLKK